MALIRQNFKYFAFIVAAMLLWSQYEIAEHDQIHSSLADNCAICKIAQTGSNAISVSDVSFSINIHNEVIYIFFLNVVSNTFLWETPLTRAPPSI